MKTTIFVPELLLMKSMVEEIANNGNVYQLELENAQKLPSVSYISEDILIIDDARELLGDRHAFRSGMFLLIMCVHGKLRLSINTEPYTVLPNDMMFCRPTTLLNDIEMSDDLDCRILCLSDRVIREHIRTDKEIWDKVFYISLHPIMHIGREGMRLFKMYSDLMEYRIRLEGRAYLEEVVESMVHIVVHELFAELDSFAVKSLNDRVRQGDILFKRFIEMLAGGHVKQRSVNHYADRLCVTPKYLSSVCKQVSGKGALEWISQYVIADIKYMLKYTQKSPKEIADELEFPNLSFFGKFVKKHLGASPTEYRRSQMKTS